MQTIDHTTKQNGSFKFRVVVRRGCGSFVQYLESSKKEMLEQATAMQLKHPEVHVFDRSGAQIL